MTDGVSVGDAVASPTETRPESDGDGLAVAVGTGGRGVLRSGQRVDHEIDGVVVEILSRAGRPTGKTFERFADWRHRRRRTLHPHGCSRAPADGINGRRGTNDPESDAAAGGGQPVGVGQVGDAGEDSG
jgi:hypothetical protein